MEWSLEIAIYPFRKNQFGENQIDRFKGDPDNNWFYEIPLYHLNQDNNKVFCVDFDKNSDTVKSKAQIKNLKKFFSIIENQHQENYQISLGS